jgi:hypothetical protein
MKFRKVLHLFFQFSKTCREILKLGSDLQKKIFALLAILNFRIFCKYISTFRHLGHYIFHKIIMYL